MLGGGGWGEEEEGSVVPTAFLRNLRRLGLRVPAACAMRRGGGGATERGAARGTKEGAVDKSKRVRTAAKGPAKAPKARPATTFERSVYTACLAIPRGSVCSYGAIADAIGAGCARSVGAALRRNPYAPIVPCHRVVASSGELGGFTGSWARGGDALAPLQLRKVQMLRGERVDVDVASGGARATVPPDAFASADALTERMPAAAEELEGIMSERSWDVEHTGSANER